jgi:CDP-diglyceride synthetase
VLALTWGLSKVLQFRPSPDGPFRLLLVYGAVLLTVATTRIFLFGTTRYIDIKDNPPSILLWVAILTWLLVLIVLCRYFPRTTGWLLLLTAAVAVPALRDWVAYIGGGTQGWTKPIAIIPVAALPLLAAGLALIRTSDRKDEDGETI